MDKRLFSLDLGVEEEGGGGGKRKDSSRSSSKQHRRRTAPLSPPLLPSSKSRQIEIRRHKERGEKKEERGKNKSEGQTTNSVLVAGLRPVLFRRRGEKEKERKSVEKAGKYEDGVPTLSPPFSKSFQLTLKSARIGFDWDKREREKEKGKRGRKKKGARKRGDNLLAVRSPLPLNVAPKISSPKPIAKFTRRREGEEKIGRINKPSKLESLWDQSNCNELSRLSAQ